MIAKFTDVAIKALDPPEKGNKRHPDPSLPGFGIRITAAGARAFYLQYRTKGGPQRVYTIGQFPVWKVAAARKEAKRLKYEVDNGHDPLGEMQGRRAAPTVSDLLDRYASEYLSEESTRLRPSTKSLYRILVENHIRPALGKQKVGDVQYTDIDKLHQNISRTPTDRRPNGSPYVANRMLSALSRIFNLAIRWQITSRNPCVGVERNQEHPRKRYLKKDELARLFEVLAADPDQQGVKILHLELYTGCRGGEAKAAKWEQFDLDGHIWVKPATSTKQKSEHSVPLSSNATILLKQLQAGATSEWVFPSKTSKNGHRTYPNKLWARARVAAGIEDVRMHDLRHTYGSVLASDGRSLPTIGALMGHTQARTTARYAHLTDNPLRAATEKAGAIISGNNVLRLQK